MRPLRFAPRVGGRRQFGEVVTVNDDGVEVNIVTRGDTRTSPLVNDGYGSTA